MTEQNQNPTVEANFGELESLRCRLAEYESRQREFDELRQRVEAFERERRENATENVAARATSVSATSVIEAFDEGTSKLLDEHKEWTRKSFARQSDFNLVELQKDFLTRKIQR